MISVDTSIGWGWSKRTSTIVHSSISILRSSGINIVHFSNAFGSYAPKSRGYSYSFLRIILSGKSIILQNNFLFFYCFFFQIKNSYINIFIIYIFIILFIFFYFIRYYCWAKIIILTNLMYSIANVWKMRNIKIKKKI